MNKTESKVYQKYRHYLATENRHGTHAAERRQNARAKVVGEFNIPYAEVKRIVAEGDKLAGVTHEAPKEYGDYAGIEFKRVPLDEVQVGDRVVYAGGPDARVIAIDGNTFTFKGLMHTGYNKSEKSTWTTTFEPEVGYGATLPIVTNRERRVPTAV